MPDFVAPYTGALFLTAAVMILIMVQSVVATIFRNAVEKYQAGEALPANHASITFRMVRSFENSLENIVIFVPVLALAIAAAVSPAWVWWVALLFLIGRAGHWAMYALNIPALRTAFFATGFFATLALAIKTALALL